MGLFLSWLGNCKFKMSLANPQTSSFGILFSYGHRNDR